MRVYFCVIQVFVFYFSDDFKNLLRQYLPCKFFFEILKVT